MDFTHHMQAKQVQQWSTIAPEKRGNNMESHNQGKSIALGKFLSPNATVTHVLALADAASTCH